MHDLQLDISNVNLLREHKTPNESKLMEGIGHKQSHPHSRAKRPTHLPGVGAPQRMQYYHRMQYLEIRYLLYDLPIQRVLRNPVCITLFLGRRTS